MSTKGHQGRAENGAPVHPDVTFEPRDIDIGTIARYLVYLAITIVLALAICAPILNVLTKFVAEQDTPMPAVRAEMTQKQRDDQQMPPMPRLQGVPGSENDPQQDMRNKMEADTKANETLGWVDKDKGIAQIPVADAMKIIADKGAVPAAPAAVAEKKQ
ncbi:MAG TPA: hypothetical protein VFN20_07300 [Candidatus Acidoferrum sp.]|jgi:hypothetical protein|nr:hypothetical protein [Candidatus Acidoferrum sp.]